MSDQNTSRPATGEAAPDGAVRAPILRLNRVTSLSDPDPSPGVVDSGVVPPSADPEALPEEERRRRFGWLRRRPKPAAPVARPPPPPPPPPTSAARRAHRWSRRSKHPMIVGLNVGVDLLVLILLIVLGAVHYGTRTFSARGPLAADKVVIIPQGSGARDVAETLRREGVIESPWLFVTGIQVSGKRNALKAGEYLFQAGISMRQAMELIESGKAVEHSITIPEGLTSEQIVARLMAEPLLQGTVGEVPPEGALLPETYRVLRGTTRAQLLARMAESHRRVLDEVWARRDPKVPVASREALVTLASIVEKETGVAAERPRVAAVFVNRLRRNMRLQSDPTIIYGLVGGKGTLGRPILRSEIMRATPYNTYAINGLPPGPIANPGRASLEAAARPMATDDLYFVADGTGGHAFATTLVEHNRNVARWREVERNSAAPAEADRVDPAEAEASPSAPAAAPRRPRRPPPRR